MEEPRCKKRSRVSVHPGDSLNRIPQFINGEIWLGLDAD